MNLNVETGVVFCHGCARITYSRYYDRDYYVARDIRTETYLNDEEVRCLKCNVLLGYTKDAPQFFHVPKEDENG